MMNTEKTKIIAKNLIIHISLLCDKNSEIKDCGQQSYKYIFLIHFIIE